MAPLYDIEAVKPMWQELARVGVRPLTTPGEVDLALSAGSSGTVLLVVNSVCGCAAGSCRPGVMLALQNAVIPDTCVTVFAGVDVEATARARSYLEGFPPSSPSVFLFKDGKIALALHRSDIETMNPLDVARTLRSAFDRECSAPGPSIPPEEFDQIDPVQQCGSAIPLYPGG